MLSPHLIALKFKLLVDFRLQQRPRKLGGFIAIRFLFNTRWSHRRVEFVGLVNECQVIVDQSQGLEILTR